MKLAFFETEPWQQEVVKKRLKGHKVDFIGGNLNSLNASKFENYDGVAVFIYSRVDKATIDKLKKTKLVATMSTGFDHVDTSYCASKKITVCNVPTYGENTVAEHTFAIILSLSRKLYPSIKRTRQDHTFSTDATLRGFDLKGKTIGIVGCGNIGKHVARMAKGFEMNILVFDTNQDKKFANDLGFEYVSMDKLLKNSDIVSLHVPYNQYTHHLINDKSIVQMKLGAYLINTSRGAVVDTNTLVKALKSGKLAGAGIDVLEGEGEVKEEAQVLTLEHREKDTLKTMLENHLLMKMDNVVVTPHNAFNSSEALMRILETTLQNIESFSKGKPLNVCSKAK